MVLQRGELERLNDPTRDQLREAVAFLQPEAPFLILSASDDAFMQATVAGGRYRVEYREQKRQHFALMSAEEAADLFERYRNGDPTLRNAVRWQRLSILNDPYHPALLAATVGCLVALVAYEAWRIFR